MPASVRAVLLAALQAAAGASLPLVTTQSWELAGATFAVVLALSILANWFHLNLTPQQEASAAAAIIPAVERLLPALLALIERQPAVAPPAAPATPPVAPAPTQPPTVFYGAPPAPHAVAVVEQPAAPTPAAPSPPVPPVAQS